MARQGWGRHSTVATGSDSGDQVSVNAWNADVNKAGMLGFTAQTIASATSISPTNSTIILSGSTNVSTIAITDTAEYDLLYVFTSGSVTLVNTSSPSSDGDIRLLANANKDLSTTTPTILIRKGNYWYEYGGGITNALDDIGDVVITSVANEDVLAYDSTTSKWINQSADETGRVTASSTTTVTNKTIDQDGTGNSITNIANASIKAAAAIDATKIADGSVTSTEFQYINTLSSNAQTQLDAKSPLAGSSSIVTTGALDSGSITSGFGAIDNGASAITTTGTITGGQVTVDNLTINANTIEATNTNGNIVLDSNGTGVIEVLGNTNDGAITLNCTSNSHGQTIKSQPHSAAVTNTMLLPQGASSTLVSLVSTDTLTNKTLTSPQINTQLDILAQGELRLQDASGGQYIGFKAPTTVTNYTLTMPGATGTQGQVLKMSSTANTLEWGTAGGGNHTEQGFDVYTTHTPTATTSDGVAYMFARKIDSNNDGLYITLWKNGASTEVQIA